MAIRNLIIVALLALIAAPNAPLAAYYQAPTSVSSSSITTTTTTTHIISSNPPVVRLRANKLRRPEFCRESLPRKSDDLPALVITGRVKELYLAGEPANAPQPTALSDNLISNNNTSGQNKALVQILRVIKGNQQLIGTDIIVGGLNGSSATPCPNYVKPNDTWIMLLQLESDRRYQIQGTNLLSMNLNNLDRINAIASDEAYKRRPQIEDILCESHYCPYGRCVVNQQQQVSCQCPDSCQPLPSPVCGSDNTTYTNECHLIKEGCKRQRPLFVTKSSSC